MDLTERKLSGREVYHGRIVNVCMDEVLLPNGRQAQREVVEPPGGVVILPLDERMQEALWALACGETTERARAEEWQLSKWTFHDRKVRALKLLRAELAARGYGRLDH